MHKRRSSLFSRLMLSIALPEIIIFSIVAVISYTQLNELFQKLSEEKVENLQEELSSIIKFQDVTLSQISRNLDREAQNKMKQLRFNYFLTSDSIETANLKRIRREIGMKDTNDIYIINRNGIIVNTTFSDDQNFDLFSIGDKFKQFLQDLFLHDYYTPQPLSLETNSRKLKKYIYQSSKDRKYIIQLGYYSTEADRINKEIAKRVTEIEKSPNDINSIDLILAPWKPFSLYKGKEMEGPEIRMIQSIFKKKEDKIVESNENTTTYKYYERTNNSAISWKGILKVVYDKKQGQVIIFKSIVQKVILFGVGMILLLLILFFNVRLIVRPIHNLSSAAKKLGEGFLDQRAKSEGTKEMVFLSESFNQMAGNLEKSHKEITRKNEEILASITYAKRIQEAIMPPQEVLQENLNELFILYKPKDIIAGDFYWFESIDDEIFIAVADCTGHGVPGALVSVVCSNSLNRAVKELRLSEPGEILDAVRDLVIETFDKSLHDVKDGMDICFCRINLKSRIVVYAGAQNSLYRITGKKEGIDDPKLIYDSSHMLVEYKANKQPIGKFTKESPFTQTKIQCEKDDILYLFTDGYPDQFGGPEGRKFMYKPFKELLLSIRDKTMDEQANILNHTFEKWKSDESQIDDVCIIGIMIS